MEVERLLDPIKNAELRNQFRTFLDTGEASEPFLDLLDSNPEYQNIVEEAFRAQATALERFAARIEAAEQTPRRTIAGGAIAAVAGAFAGGGVARASRGAATSASNRGESSPL